MKLHLLFLYVALFNIGVTPTVLAKPSFSNHTHLDQTEAAPLLLKAPKSSSLAQASPPPEVGKEQVAQITAVQLKPTPRGLEVILETTGTFAEVLTSSAENSLITDIPNAQLRLPRGREFRQDNPTDTITAIRVENLDDKTIRVTVTGKAGVPNVEVSQSPQALILSMAAPPAQPPPAPTTPSPATPAREKSPTEPDQQTKPPAAPAPEAKEEELLEFEVKAEEEAGGYDVPDATTATKTDTPIRDIPQAIQVIPRQVIEDRQVVRLNELTDNVSGVQRVPGYGGLSSFGVRIRGFTLQFENLRNGFRDFGYQSPRDVANVERVEILKGPASALYGGGVVGFSGLVNTITKKPLEQPFYQFDATFGNFDFYRPTLDITGPLTSDRSLLYRLVSAYENSNGFRDFSQNESGVIAPSLTWKLGPRTKLTLEYERQSQNYFFDNGYPTEPEFLELPRDRFILGEPDLNRANWTTDSVTSEFQHEFSDDWKFRQGFNVLLSTGGQQSAFGFDPLVLQL